MVGLYREVVYQTSVFDFQFTPIPQNSLLDWDLSNCNAIRPGAPLHRARMGDLRRLPACVSVCWQAMVKDWEQCKGAVESSRQPELMLIVDSWKQLQFVSREYLAQYAPLYSLSAVVMGSS